MSQQLVGNYQGTVWLEDLLISDLIFYERESLYLFLL